MIWRTARLLAPVVHGQSRFKQPFHPALYQGVACDGSRMVDLPMPYALPDGVRLRWTRAPTHAIPEFPDLDG